MRMKMRMKWDEDDDGVAMKKMELSREENEVRKERSEEVNEELTEVAQGRE